MASTSMLSSRTCATITWKIENFSFYSESPGQYFESSEVKLSIFKSDVTTSLKLYPRGNTVQNADFISCFICGLSKNVQCEIVLLNVCGIRSNAKRNFKISDGHDVGLHRLIKRETVLRNKLEFLPNDVLTVQAHVWGSEKELAVVLRTRVKILQETFTFKVNNVIPFLDELLVTEVNWPKLKVRLDSNNKFQFTVFDFPRNKAKVYACTITLTDFNGKRVLMADEQYFCNLQQGTVQKWTLKNKINNSAIMKALRNGSLEGHCKFQVSSNKHVHVLESCPQKIKSSQSNLSFKETPSTSKYKQFSSRQETFSNCISFKHHAEESKQCQQKYPPFKKPKIETDVPKVLKKSSMEQFCNPSVHIPFQNKSTEHKSIQTDNSLFLSLQKSCDITIIPRNAVPIRAHRKVLKRESEKFCVLFRNKPDETELYVPELDEDTVIHMLEFMYTGFVSDSLTDIKLTHLHAAGLRYGIPGLNVHCREMLKSRLNVDSACKLLKYASDADDAILKAVAVKFLLEKGKKVFISGEWTEFSRHNAQLAWETMQKFLSIKTKM